MHCHLSGWEGALIPSAVLAASLAGSGHCALMCGGLVSAAAKTSLDQALYHTGRLAGYLILGALSGWIGGRTVARLPDWGSAALAWAVGLSFVWIGVTAWRKGAWHFELPGSAWVSRWIHRGIIGDSAPFRTSGYAAAIGFLSIFLPCGWLYGFVLASLSTADAARGSWLMLFFWAGTLPALALSGWIIRGIARITGAFAPKVSAVLLMTAGILPLILRYLPARP